jgi:hypothetical protein
MHIVGLTGGIGHGKTTFAADLAAVAPSQRHYESSSVIMEVANAWRQNLDQATPPASDDFAAINSWLKALLPALRDITHVQTTVAAVELTPERLQQHPEYYQKLFDYLDLLRAQPELQTGAITTDNKTIFRSLLQWLGGYAAKTVHDGIWFEEIVRRIKAAPAVDLVTVGGIRFPADANCLRAIDAKILQISRPDYGELDKHDITERERATLEVDSLILNDSDLASLQRLATQVYADLTKDKLRTRYIASEHTANA